MPSLLGTRPGMRYRPFVKYIKRMDSHSLRHKGNTKRISFKLASNEQELSA